MDDVRLQLPRMVVFAQVIEQGSMTAAARALRVSRPAVSAAIAALERSMGVTLLHRTTRTLEPTPAGRELFAAAQRIHNEARTALAAATHESTRGRLRIKSPAGIVAERIVAPAVAQVVREHDLQVDLECSDTRTAAVEGNVDAVIRLGTARQAGLIMRKAGTTHDVVLASPEVAASVSAPAELGTQGWILHSDLPRRIRLGRGDDSVALTMRESVIVNDSGALVGLVRSGAGVGVAPRAAVREELEAGTLVELFPSLPVRKLQLFVLLPSRKTPARVRLLVDALKRSLARA
ncbi:MAG: LysR family transcriptional regulator [Myxococcota bacterium]